MESKATPVFFRGSLPPIAPWFSEKWVTLTGKYTFQMVRHFPLNHGAMGGRVVLGNEPKLTQPSR